MKREEGRKEEGKARKTNNNNTASEFKNEGE